MRTAEVRTQSVDGTPRSYECAKYAFVGAERPGSSRVSPLSVADNADNQAVAIASSSPTLTPTATSSNSSSSSASAKNSSS